MGNIMLITKDILEAYELGYMFKEIGFMAYV